ncbi:MAG: DUF2905 domain-containing protein [Bacteroidota bacterium]|nr:DUF2905 domain-containing protein [Bacteroidota bacterium]
MPDIRNNMGRLFIFIGIGLVVIGIIIKYAPGLLNWFGKLPGDIRIVNENRKIFIPITSMVVISLIITVIVNLIRFFRKG